MWTEIEECRPDINLYNILSSWHNSSDGSGKRKETKRSRHDSWNKEDVHDVPTTYNEC